MGNVLTRAGVNPDQFIELGRSHPEYPALTFVTAYRFLACNYLCYTVLKKSRALKVSALQLGQSF